MAGVAGLVIPKLDIFGQIVQHASTIVMELNPDFIVVGPVTRSNMPAMYKVGVAIYWRNC